jgi:hypothetical protein
MSCSLIRQIGRVVRLISMAIKNPPPHNCYGETAAEMCLIFKSPAEKEKSENDLSKLTELLYTSPGFRNSVMLPAATGFRTSMTFAGSYSYSNKSSLAITDPILSAPMNHCKIYDYFFGYFLTKTFKYPISEKNPIFQRCLKFQRSVCGKSC